MAIEFQTASQQEWRKLALQSPYATVFHEYSWNEMVASQLGATFEPIIANEDDRKWLLPLYRSLPGQGDDEIRTSGIGYGGPLASYRVEDGGYELDVCVKIAEKLQNEVGNVAIGGALYPAQFWPIDKASVVVNFGSTCKVPVGDDLDTMFERTLTGNARTAVRKSAKNGVIVGDLDVKDEDMVDAAISLLHATQESVGSSYRTEKELFSKIGNLSEKDAEGRIFIAKVDTRLVGVVACAFNRQELFHLFHGWDREASATCANQALHWRMISLAVEKNVGAYNMGESHTPQLQAAKLRWGGHIEPVPKLSLGAQN